MLKAANYFTELWEKCLNEKTRFVFETVLSGDDKIDFILRAKSSGSFIRLFFIATNHHLINATRIANRVIEGVHDVPI